MISGFIRTVIPARFRPIGYLTHLVRHRTGDVVRLGPFAGMRYIENSMGSAHLPKLLGTYERELARVIEEVCGRRLDRILVLGAAEGYYAVGLALRNPTAQVMAFEREESGRAALYRMACLNGVGDQVRIFGECGPRELRLALETGSSRCREHKESSFVLCDVEGDEEQLLDPVTVPGLERVCILAETHEFACRGITERLQQRFRQTHRVERIWQEERSRSDFPFRTTASRLLPKSYLEWAVSEWRPMKMCWLWMQPHE